MFRRPKIGGWTCLLCGHGQILVGETIIREGSCCLKCSSTWRNRAVVYGLMLGLRLPHVPVVEWETNWSIVGVGFDDHPSIFASLPTRVSYVNTHLARFPKLDLRELPREAIGQMDFVICSDVMEHVEPPVERGMEGLIGLLKPGGIAIISVPVHQNARLPTNENYPDLVRHQICDGGSLRWWDSSGQEHLDQTPEYHGGTGLVLSFRTFGTDDLIHRLTNLGFRDVQEVPACPELGVFELKGHGVLVAHT